MDSTTAALIGTSAGFFGSLIGSVLTPFWLRRSDRKQKRSDDREDGRRRLIPRVIEVSMEAAGLGGDTLEISAKKLVLVTELEAYLDPEDWPISRMVMMAGLSKTEDSGKVMGQLIVLQAVLTSWMTGRTSTQDAKAKYESETDTEVREWGGLPKEKP